MLDNYEKPLFYPLAGGRSSLALPVARHAGGPPVLYGPRVVTGRARWRMLWASVHGMVCAFILCVR